MPRPGETAEPQYKRGKELGYGDATAANVLGQLAPTPGLEEDLLHQPQGEEEEFLFGPTDRPDEPVTAGAPLGAGPDFTSHAFETDKDLMRRVVGQLAQNPSKEVRQFIARAERGL